MSTNCFHAEEFAVSDASSRSMVEDKNEDSDRLLVG